MFGNTNMAAPEWHAASSILCPMKGDQAHPSRAVHAPPSKKWRMRVETAFHAHPRTVPLLALPMHRSLSEGLVMSSLPVLWALRRAKLAAVCHQVIESVVPPHVAFRSYSRVRCDRLQFLLTRTFRRTDVTAARQRLSVVQYVVMQDWSWSW